MAAKTTVSSRKLFLKKEKSSTEAGTDYFDYNLLAVIILLMAFGLVMQYSVKAYDVQVSHSTAFLKQTLIAAVGVIVMTVMSRFNYHGLLKWSGWAYLAANAILFATKFIGTTVNGARRWIKIGPIQFQSAEVAKLAIIIFFPTMIVMKGRKFRGWKAPAEVFAFGAFTALLTRFFTDNLSTAIIIMGITFVIVVVAHPHPQKLVFVFFVGLAAAAVLYFVMKGQVQAGGGSFRLRRIQVWLNPEANQKEGGYQVMQGLYAIGSGGLFGKGLGNSTQKLGALPEAENDMIFAIICEELGMVGAMIVIGLFVYMLVRLFFISVNAPDLAGSLIAVGIFAHVAIQVILNIAVVLNVIPTTGITLPFVSFGGTSIIFLMAEMGIALNISGQIREKK